VNQIKITKLKKMDIQEIIMNHKVEEAIKIIWVNMNDRKQNTS